MRVYFLLATVPLFYGCFATNDIIHKSNLPESDRALLSSAVEMASKSCVKIQYDSVGNKKDSSATAISVIHIKRYYASDIEWIKLEVNSAGVWDNIYFNQTKNIIVCGQKDWESYTDSKFISFTEFGTERKTLSFHTSSMQQNLVKSIPIKSTIISTFRAKGLSQIKYQTDAELCADLKFGFEFIE